MSSKSCDYCEDAIDDGDCCCGCTAATSCTKCIAAEERYEASKTPIANLAEQCETGAAPSIEALRAATGGGSAAAVKAKPGRPKKTIRPELKADIDAVIAEQRKEEKAAAKRMAEIAGEPKPKGRGPSKKDKPATSSADSIRGMDDWQELFEPGDVLVQEKCPKDYGGKMIYKATWNGEEFEPLSGFKHITTPIKDPVAFVKQVADDICKRGYKARVSGQRGQAFRHCYREEDGPGNSLWKMCTGNF